MKSDLSALPTGVLIGLGVLLVAELALDVIALVSLSRRPVNRVTLGNKWIWVAIILLVSLVGPILYFVVGRKPGALAEGSSPEPRRESSPESIADSLYGRRDGSAGP